MKTQLRTIGLGMMLAVLPMATTASAQWTPQGQTVVNYNVGNMPTQHAPTAPVEANSIHTVAVNANGTLVGQVASIDANTKTATGLQGLNVFFVRDGQVVNQTQTTNDGSFSVQGISEGAYSFFAAGRSGFAAYGIYVTGPNENSTQNLLEASTASSNYNGIQQLLQHSVPAQVRQSVATASQGESQGSAVQTTNQIRLINGRLKGQISSLYGQTQLGSGVQVQLIQNDRSIAQVQTNADGSFSIPDVALGVYDYVVASQNGLAAGRFEAVGSRSAMTQISYRKTAMQLDACLTCPNQPVDNGMTTDTLIEPSYGTPIEYAGESIGYGGASGGSSGSVGNFSNFSGKGVVRGRFGGGGSRLRLRGGSGMNRLLTLAGLGLGIAAIADDDDPAPGSPVNN